MNALPPPHGPAGTADLVDLREMWRTVTRYKWNVAGIIVVMTLIGVLHAFSADRIYRATITVLVENRPNRAVDVQEVYDPGYGGREFLGTQFQLLRSRELAGRVIDRLDLAENEEVTPTVATPTLWQRITGFDWAALLPFLPDDAGDDAVEESPERKRDRAIAALQRSVTVEPIMNTQLMRVHVNSRSPTLATDIANTIGEVYVDSGLESRLQATEHATRWLTQRLADLRSKLEASEKALQRYREQYELVNVGGARGLVEEELLDNSRKLRDAQRRKTELASSYWKIQQANDDSRQLEAISSLLLDPPVQKASENLSAAQQSVKQLQERYGEKHPQMTAAQARLDAATRAYHEQLRRAANGIKAEYEIAAETERALLGVVDATRDQIRKLDQRDYELKGLEREVLTNRELYELFLKRFKETDTASTYEPLTARVVDHAVVPLRAYKPDKRKIVTLWALAGVILGLVLAALRHVLSETIRSPDQLEEMTQLPVISVLPPVAGLGRKISPPALCIDQPRIPFSEGVRSIRTSLHLSDVDKNMRSIMVTSALPKEGKSSIASSFAAVLAQSERVVLVEADLRAPTLKRVFGIGKDAPGLMEVLTEQTPLELALFHDAKTGIDVLPVANVPPNPAEVIASAAFSRLMETLSSRYDRVIYDTPPCLVASDSILLSHRMNAVLFVIHGGTTGVRAVHTALKQLRGAQAPMLGHVLNRVDARKAYGHEGTYYAYGQYGS